MNHFGLGLLLVFAIQISPAPTPPQLSAAPTQEPIKTKVETSKNPSAPVVEKATLPEPQVEKITLTIDGEQRVIEGEELKKMLAQSKDNSAPTTQLTSSLVFKNGAFHFEGANFSIPLIGGGASGCFGNIPPERIARIKEEAQKIKEAEGATAPEKK